MFGCGRQAYEGTIDDDNIPSTVTAEPPTPDQQQGAVPPGYVTTPETAIRRQPTATPVAPAATQPTRNRVSSKQLGAVWAIARKAGLEQASLRAQVKVQFGSQLEFLSRQQASELIDALSRKVSANGHAPSGAEAALQG